MAPEGIGHVLRIGIGVGDYEKHGDTLEFFFFFFAHALFPVVDSLNIGTLKNAYPQQWPMDACISFFCLSLPKISPVTHLS
jgi:hypothetical protein